MNRRRLSSYGGLHSAECEFFEPATVDELRLLLQRARAEGRRVTLRAAGFAFDGQALNEDWVICMKRFDGIRVDASAARVTVGPSAIWGDIVRATVAHGLLMPIVVTTRYATAGGTLASNGLGRFSSIYGKEADWVERILLLTPEGWLVECTRKARPDLLFGVVGGHGYLGVVVEATYRLMPIGRSPKVRHRIHKTRGFEALLCFLLERRGAEPDDAVTALVIPDGSERAIGFHARVLEEGRLRRLPGLSPSSFARSAIEWALRSARLSRLVWQMSFRTLLREDVEYVDPLEDYLFFMDGNVQSRRLGACLGLELRAIQQSFAIPLDARDPSSGGKAVDFLRNVNRALSRHRAASVFFDVLVIRRETASLLSSTRHFDALLVSLAFEPSGAPEAARVRACLEELSLCCSELGGVVHLTKNVFAPDGLLETMYGRALDEFFALKSNVDPYGILQNDFLARVAPANVAALRRPAPGTHPQIPFNRPGATDTKA